MNPFHAGEIALQQRAGVRSMAERVGKSIGARFPPVARDFVASQRVAYFSIANNDGELWTHLLSGEAGFLRVEADETLHILAPSLPDAREGAAVGLLLLEAATRRRMRCNGVLERSEIGWSVRPTQVYSNCPKYIQARDIIGADGAKLPQTVGGTALNSEIRAWIEGADTFFIGTRHETGVDCSHRGGSPGFVRVQNEALVWPDYAGNAMFNTLGNLESDPSCGLLFVDFERGATLQLTGRAQVNWQGTEREVEFVPSAWRITQNATLWRFGAAAFLPFNPPLA